MPMNDALTNGDHKELQALLSMGVSPDFEIPIEGGSVPVIFFAIDYNEPTCVKTLLDAHANADAVADTPQGGSALMRAIQKNNFMCLKHLLVGRRFGPSRN